MVWRVAKQKSQFETALTDQLQAKQGEVDALREVVADLKDSDHDDTSSEQECGSEGVDLGSSELIPFFREVTLWDRMKAASKLAIGLSMLRFRYVRYVALAAAAGYIGYKLYRRTNPIAPAPVGIVQLDIVGAQRLLENSEPHQVRWRTLLKTFDVTSLYKRSLRWGEARKIGVCDVAPVADLRLHTSQTASLKQKRVEVSIFEVHDFDSCSTNVMAATEQQISQITTRCPGQGDQALVPRVAQSVITTNIPSSLSHHTTAGSQYIASALSLNDRLRTTYAPNPIWPAPFWLVMVIAMTTLALPHRLILNRTISAFVKSARLSVG